MHFMVAHTHHGADVFGAFHSSQAYTLLGKYTVGELVTEDRNKHTGRDRIDRFLV